MLVNEKNQPFFHQKFPEFARKGVNFPSSFLYIKEKAKWQSLARILELQYSQNSPKEKLGSLISLSMNINSSYANDKTPSFLSKNDNSRLREENDKLKTIIASLEKKLQKNLAEMEDFRRNSQEIETNKDLDLYKSKTLEELEALNNEKDSILAHLSRLNEDYNAYNQQLMKLKGEKTRDSQLLLFQFSAIKDPKAQIKAKIKELKEENGFLKHKIAENYGVNLIEKPQDISLQFPLNKRPRSYDAQLINMTRNSFDMSPPKIFDPMRSFKVENYGSDIEVFISSSYKEKTNENPDKIRESVKKTTSKGFEVFSNEEMNESAILEVKDKPFFRKTNKKEESFFKINDKLRENGFKVTLGAKSKEFKDFEEFANGRLNQLKKSCLLNKGVLFEDGDIQLGFTSGVFYHKEEILLKITAFFGNLSEEEFENFEVKFIGNSSKFNDFSKKTVILLKSDKFMDEKQGF